MQSFKSPDPINGGTLDEEQIEVGSSVGRFQSGDGIILSASTLQDNPENLRLEIGIFNPDTNELVTFGATNFDANGSGSVTFGSLPVGEYFWGAIVVDDEQDDESEPVEFMDNF